MPVDCPGRAKPDVIEATAFGRRKINQVKRKKKKEKQKKLKHNRKLRKKKLIRVN
ncbi:MAG: hypothetical protein P8Y70_18535 [Candidatus Lokiarchaeota archaeon]